VAGEGDQDDLLEGLLHGEEPIKPIIARLTSVIEELGNDVVVEPRRTSVAFSRGRLFALLQPSGATRLDVCLVLPDADEGERLRPAAASGVERITHSVSLAHEDEIDGELTGWLRTAYAAAATT
jgi:hypothetical protein